MLTRMMAALAVLLGLGIMTAWAWDRSDNALPARVAYDRTATKAASVQTALP